MEPDYLPTISTPVWIFFCVLLTGILIHIIGFSTPYWVKSTNHHSGLWKACVHGNCISNPYTVVKLDRTLARTQQVINDKKCAPKYMICTLCCESLSPRITQINGKKMADFWEADILVKIFCSVFLLGLTVHVIGFSTPHWSDNGHVHNGLWKFCDDNGECSDVVDVYYRKILNDITWFEATQAFEMIGVIAGLVGLILVILYVFVTKTAGNRTVYLVALAAISVACGGTILGVIIYGSQSVHLSWSFGLTIVGGVIYGLTVGLMIMHIIRN